MILGKGTILELMKEEPPLVENLICPDIQIQVNGIDMTIGEIFVPKGAGFIDFTNDKRCICEYEEIHPIISFVDEEQSQYCQCYKLEKGTYIVRLHEKVNIPKDIIGLIRPRSSLMRNGVNVSSSIWDSGYHGRGYVLMMVENPHGIKLTKDTRICQMYFVFLDRETDGYKGIFQGE